MAVVAIKMDELLVSWLGSDAMYENVLDLIESNKLRKDESNTNFVGNNNGSNICGSNGVSTSGISASASANSLVSTGSTGTGTIATSLKDTGEGTSVDTADNISGGLLSTADDTCASSVSTSGSLSASTMSTRIDIPLFYPPREIASTRSSSASSKPIRRRRKTVVLQNETWEPIQQGKKNDEGITTKQDSIGVENNTNLHALKDHLSNDDNEDSEISPATPLQSNSVENNSPSQPINLTSVNSLPVEQICVRDQVRAIYAVLGHDPPLTSPSSIEESPCSPGDDNAFSPSKHQEMKNNDDNILASLNRKYLTRDNFVRITKEVCKFPSFFNGVLYQRILDLWNLQHCVNTSTAGGRDNAETNAGDEGSDVRSGMITAEMDVITLDIFHWYWLQEMECYDASDRFFRLTKQIYCNYITRDDFLPYIKALLQDHPGLEFLSNHAEFQEKYAVTVITRIFYSVNKCHSGRITSRQIRLSDLLDAFQSVDEEEDINKVTRYFSYEHFYVLYCRFWELDHDRDYRITREDLLKYGDHSLSHMIVDRIFDAAPRPFINCNNNTDNVNNSQDNANTNNNGVNREYLSYEDFIYFMLSEEDKSNEVSVRYWFSCVDVDGDGKLNNMEMRSFYAVQLHRMQLMGHEIVPFEDMLCQMMDMIKPTNTDYLIVEDFLQNECKSVSGALFDALFNLNKYLLFEQRDPFVERQKREDEFDTDWDRFACIDYNRLAMEEEAREEEAMEIDWVTVDDGNDHDVNDVVDLGHHSNDHVIDYTHQHHTTDDNSNMNIGSEYGNSIVNVGVGVAGTHSANGNGVHNSSFNSSEAPF